jgi:hypothetical protein
VNSDSVWLNVLIFLLSIPLRALTHFKSRNLDQKDSLEVLAVHKADLVLSFGYESEVEVSR